MNMDILGFFQEHMDALPLYEAFEENLLQTVENVRIKVQKSQISFYNRHLFACVSFLQVRKKKACPLRFLVITLGLDHPLPSPRVDAATSPYPGRWTHHILISDVSEIDEELMSWVKEAALFSDSK